VLNGNAPPPLGIANFIKTRIRTKNNKIGPTFSTTLLKTVCLFITTFTGTFHVNEIPRSFKEVPMGLVVVKRLYSSSVILFFNDIKDIVFPVPMY
jgi:hypothetical protein